MRYRFTTRRVELWEYVVDTDRELTEGEVATMGGDEWEDLTKDADCDVLTEDEEYEQRSLRRIE